MTGNNKAVLMECNEKSQKIYWNSEHKFRKYDHPIVAFFALQRIRLIDSIIDLSACESCLDVGCGDGFSTFYLNKKIERDVYGGDYSPKMLSSHPMRHHIITFDAQYLPFKDDQFDLVNSWELLHHMNRPEEAIREMRRVARKYIVIFEPNRWNPAQFLFALFEKEHRWVLRYTRDYLYQLCSKAGVENIIFYAKCGLIFPNKTPFWLFYFLKQFAIRQPLGISQVLVGEIDG